MDAIPRKRCTNEQVAFALRQAENGATVDEVCLRIRVASGARRMSMPILGSPRRYQSGDVDINGRIAKCGDRLTRKLLFEAANAILSRISIPLALKDGGAAIGWRSGFWKARVALACKLSVILHRTWINERPFEPKVIAMACYRFASKAAALPGCGHGHLGVRFVTIRNTRSTSRGL